MLLVVSSWLWCNFILLNNFELATNKDETRNISCELKFHIWLLKSCYLSMLCGAQPRTIGDENCENENPTMDEKIEFDTYSGVQW